MSWRGVKLLSAPLVELPLTARFEMRARGSVLSDIVLGKKTLKRSYITDVIIQ